MLALVIRKMATVSGRGRGKRACVRAHLAPGPSGFDSLAQMVYYLPAVWSKILVRTTETAPRLTGLGAFL
jgi:hypothetical protein